MNSLVQTPTNNLAESLDFYKRLGFKVLSAENPTLVTDGMALIEINPDRFARAGVKLFQSSWSDEIQQLKELTAVLKTDTGYVLASPSGIWIYLIEGEMTIDFEKGEKSYGATGSYAGVSLESMDMERSAKIWQILHCKIGMGEVSQGWVGLVYKNEMTISLMKPLMCPHLFFNPSLTYFNGKTNNPIVIEKIRAANIPITEEITVFNEEGLVDNIIIRDPGGLGFFLFNDG